VKNTTRSFDDLKSESLYEIPSVAGSLKFGALSDNCNVNAIFKNFIMNKIQVRDYS
jgi:hypothetical protein